MTVICIVIGSALIGISLFPLEYTPNVFRILTFCIGLSALILTAMGEFFEDKEL